MWCTASWKLVQAKKLEVRSTLTLGQTNINRTYLDPSSCMVLSSSSDGTSSHSATQSIVEHCEWNDSFVCTCCFWFVWLWLTFHSVPPFHQAVCVLRKDKNRWVTPQHHTSRDITVCVHRKSMTVNWKIWVHAEALTPSSSSSSRPPRARSSIWAASHSAWVSGDRNKTVSTSD